MRAKFAHKTKTELETLNPVLLDGEVIFEKDTKGIKVGDGNLTYKQLEYYSGNLNSKNIIFVNPEDTKEKSAINFKNAYIKAKTMNPSISNPITILVAPGNYSWGVTEIFILDTPYINIISLTGQPDVILGALKIIFDSPTLWASTKFLGIVSDPYLPSPESFLFSGIPMCIFENCIFEGKKGVGSPMQINYGTYINCIFSGIEMLLGDSSSYVNVINCKSSSGGGFNVRGKYVDCLSTSQDAFLANNSKYVRCVAEEGGFQGSNNTYINCELLNHELSNIFAGANCNVINCIASNLDDNNKYIVVPNRFII